MGGQDFLAALVRFAHNDLHLRIDLTGCRLRIGLRFLIIPANEDFLTR